MSARGVVNPWSDREDEVVKQLYKSLGAILVAERLGRSVASVRSRAADLGLTTQRRRQIEEGANQC